MPPIIWPQVPAITLTNEENQDAVPSPAFSPHSPDANRRDARSHFAARWLISNNNSTIDGNIAAATSVDPGGRMQQSTCRAFSESPIPAVPVAAPMSETRFSPSRLRKARTNHGSTASAFSLTGPGTTGAVRPPSPAMAAVVAREVRLAMDHDMHAQHAIDPLSSTIIKRTSSASPLVVHHHQQQQQHQQSLDQHSPQQLTRRSSSSSQKTAASMRTDDAVSRSRSRSSQRPDVPGRAREDLKKGVKAVSFLSRLMGNVKRKESVEPQVDSISVGSDPQIEGNEAEVFTQQTSDAAGFTLRNTRPPDYVKVRSRYKERREFDRIFLAQELQCSKRRKLIRTDSNRLVRRKSSGTAEADTVWAMEFSRDGMHMAAAGSDTIVRVWKVLSSLDDRKAHESQEANSDHLQAPVFQQQPVREYEGHEAPVLDLSWSKNNFLISSSMDKTVRLWHLSRAECLCTFKHNDFVPSIAFHPKDDRFFLTGSLDSKLRLWNVSEKNVAYSISVPDMITAVGFMPDGKMAISGTRNGSCYFYETEGFKYKTQLQIRPDKGQGIAGPKITALQTAQGRGGDKVLVTSNDSRIRLYNFRDKGCEMVFKGNVNDASQIRGSLSDDGRYVVCGSEDRRAFIWSVTPTETGKMDKKPVEYFDAHDTCTTAVCIAPAKTRKLLAQSEDPIYDLTASTPNLALARTESHGSSKPPTEAPSQLTEADTQGALDRSNSVLAHNGYKNGNIIVTADYAGKIKVFRQDCAWHKRQQDDGDRSSVFKRSERASMASSLQTRSSQRSLRDARNAAMAQVASSDRIMTWRQGIGSNPNNSQAQTPHLQHSRDSSPTTTRTSHDGNTTSAGSPATIPTSTASEQPHAAADAAEVAKDVYDHEAKQVELHDSICLDGNRSYLFWDKTVAIDRSRHAQQMYQSSMNAAIATEESPLDPAIVLGPALQHTISRVSRLSDEEDDHESDDEHFDDAAEHHDS